MRTFELNGKTVVAKEFDFNLICDFEEAGLNIAEMDGKDMSFLRAYIAACLGVSKEEAGKEIGAHIVGGGDLAAIADTIDKMVEESGFFQNGEKKASPKRKAPAKKAE